MTTYSNIAFLCCFYGLKTTNNYSKAISNNNPINNDSRLAANVMLYA